MEDLEILSTKLAALLLMHEGEIALSEIEALPFVDSREKALSIAASLASFFDVEMYQRKEVEGGANSWEYVIRLRAAVSTASACPEKAACANRRMR